ncbi:MAG: uracil-DNA glycosylase [Acidimicrobiales bacterium]|jgi:DNA polymerase
MADFEEMSTCERCALAATRQRVVIGSGPLDAPLMIIGEAPGRTEDEGGAPFIGPSGKLFFTLLAEETGLVRESCYVTNVVKCRPPANRTPTPHEIETCRPWLVEQLDRVAPKFILTLGNTAGRAIFAYESGIGRVHGHVYRSGVIRGIPTYHPAAALRGGPSVVEVMREDLRVLRRLMEAS